MSTRAYCNPNGSAVDANGVDSGSVYHQALAGVSGTVTLDPRALGVFPGVFHSVRVFATNGPAIVGEASDTSAFEMDGVVPPDGGTVFSHALNTAGSDGLLTSVQLGCVTISSTNVFDIGYVQATGSATGSAAMTFDQTTLQITNPAVTTSPDCDSQPLIVANDTGVLYDRGTRAFAAVPNLSSPGSSIQYLSFPSAAIPNDLPFGSTLSSYGASTQGVLLFNPQEIVGGDASSPVVSFFGMNVPGFGASTQGTAFSMNVATQATSPVTTIDDFLSFGFPTVLGEAYDYAKNVGYYAIYDAFNENVPATILAVDYGANTHTTFSAGGFGPDEYAAFQPFLAVDPVTQKLLFATESSIFLSRTTQFHIVDLATKSVTIVAPSQYAGQSTLGEVLVDPVNHLFIVQEVTRDGDAGNLAFPSGIDVFDETGNLVKHFTTPYADFPFGRQNPGTNLTYVDGAQRRLFVASPSSVAGVPKPELMTIDY